MLLEAFFPFRTFDDNPKEPTNTLNTAANNVLPAEQHGSTGTIPALPSSQLHVNEVLALPSATTQNTTAVTNAGDENYITGTSQETAEVLSQWKEDHFEQQVLLSDDTDDNEYNSGEEQERARDFLSHYQEAQLPLPVVKQRPERIIFREELALPWAIDGLLEGTLKFFAEQSDMQMCCTLLLVFSVGKPIGIDDATQIDWFLNYVELLDLWQLWTVRGVVIRLCNHVEIKRLSQESTTIYASCAGCNKPLNSGGICSRCRRPTKCALCHTPVKDLYVWCQVWMRMRSWWLVVGGRID